MEFLVCFECFGVHLGPAITDVGVPRQGFIDAFLARGCPTSAFCLSSAERGTLSYTSSSSTVGTCFCPIVAIQRLYTIRLDPH